MAFGFVSAEAIGRTIQMGGLFRNNANFFLFILEESYQTLGMLTSTLYRNQEYDRCYEVTTYAIQELAQWCNLCEVPALANILYPMNVAYLAFFRSEIIAMIQFRNQSAASATSQPAGIFKADYLGFFGSDPANTHKFLAVKNGVLSLEDLDGTPYYLGLST